MAIWGIDVSEHNGTLNWKTLKSAGVQFAIIRAGYGSKTTDSKFTANIKGAIANGIPVGIYWFSYALNASQAKAEAQKCCNLLRGYNITLPVFYDFEYDTIRYAKDHGVSLGKQEFNDMTVAFCDEVVSRGYRAGVYYNLDYKNRFVDASRLNKYTQWYAQYASNASWDRYDIWQYSSTYRISGHNCNFDVNWMTDAAAEKLINGSGISESPGWKSDPIGWWYTHEDGSYTKSDWEYIDDKWYYFDSNGYMLINQWIKYNGDMYHLGEFGAMDTTGSYEIANDGKLAKKDDEDVRYEKVKDVPSVYRETIDKLVASGVLKGREGVGEDRVIDLAEDSVRLLVILDRAGVFG